MNGLDTEDAPAWRHKQPIRIGGWLLSFVVLLSTWPSPAAAAEPPTDRYEPGVLPVLAGDTDVGFKFGIFAQLSRYRGLVRPYAWSAQALAAASVKEEATGTEFPYREAFARLDWPAAHRVIRPAFELAYSRTTNRGYYGLGNASHAERLWSGLPEGSDAYVAARRFYQFDGAILRTAISLTGSPLRFLRTLSSVRVERTLVDIYPGSQLDLDLSRGAGAGEQVYGARDQTAVVFGTGVALDTRDHETVPTSGQHLQLVFRWSPGAFDSDPYVGSTLNLRSWFPVAGDGLVLGVRFIVDVVSERAPLLELGQYGGFKPGAGPGGGMGVRGIPDGRLLGRTKLIGNVEARSMFFPFELAGERFVLGTAVFADAGRVYTDTFSSVPALDGSPWTVHPGFGGGVRLRWGDSLLIRGDVAYASLGAESGAAPGIYVDVEHPL